MLPSSQNKLVLCNDDGNDVVTEIVNTFLSTKKK